MTPRTIPPAGATGPATVLIAGAGGALGIALLQRLAAMGRTAILVDRDTGRLERAADILGPSLVTRLVDAEDEDAVLGLFAWIAAEHPQLELVVWNQDSPPGVDGLETSGRQFEQAWRASCFGAFQLGREAARWLLPRGHGGIVFIGDAAAQDASAEVASAQSALRALAQSMARELWPKGLHIAHALVDGAADAASAAATILGIQDQARNAWTFTLDIRAGASTG